MALVIVGSAKGSPGATTLAVAVAQCWPGSATVVECDLAGGDLAARFDLSPTPNLVDLVARMDETSADPWHGVRQGVPGDAGVVVGGVADWEVTGRINWADLGEYLATPDQLVIADVGRIGAGPIEVFGPLAKSIVLVAQRELSAVAHVKGIVEWVRDTAPKTPLALALVGEGPWSDQEVSMSVGVQVLASVGWVSQLAAPPKRSRVPDLRSLERPSRKIAARLEELLGTPAQGIEGGRKASTMPELSVDRVPPAPGGTESVEVDGVRRRAPRVVYGPGVRSQQNGRQRAELSARMSELRGAPEDEDDYEDQVVLGEEAESVRRPDAGEDGDDSVSGQASTDQPGGSPRRRVRPGQPGDPGLRSRVDAR